MSPRLAESASDSRRASSDLMVANRDINRVRAAPPQRGQRRRLGGGGPEHEDADDAPTVATLVLVDRHAAQFYAPVHSVAAARHWAPRVSRARTRDADAAREARVTQCVRSGHPSCYSRETTMISRIRASGPADRDPSPAARERRGTGAASHRRGRRARTLAQGRARSAGRAPARGRARAEPARLEDGQPAARPGPPRIPFSGPETAARVARPRRPSRTPSRSARGRRAPIRRRSAASSTSRASAARESLDVAARRHQRRLARHARSRESPPLS